MPWCPKCGGEYREGFSFHVDRRYSAIMEKRRNRHALVSKMRRRIPRGIFLLR